MLGHVDDVLEVHHDQFVAARQVDLAAMRDHVLQDPLTDFLGGDSSGVWAIFGGLLVAMDQPCDRCSFFVGHWSAPSHPCGSPAATGRLPILLPSQRRIPPVDKFPQITDPPGQLLDRAKVPRDRNTGNHGDIDEPAGEVISDDLEVEGIDDKATGEGCWQSETPRLDVGLIVQPADGLLLFGRLDVFGVEVCERQCQVQSVLGRLLGIRDDRTRRDGPGKPGESRVHHKGEGHFRPARAGDGDHRLSPATSVRQNFPPLNNRNGGADARRRGHQRHHDAPIRSAGELLQNRVKLVGIQIFQIAIDDFHIVWARIHFRARFRLIVRRCAFRHFKPWGRALA